MDSNNGTERGIIEVVKKYKERQKGWMSDGDV